MNGPLINYNSCSRFLDYDSEWDSCDWIIVKNIILTQILTPAILNVRTKFRELWTTDDLLVLIKNYFKSHFLKMRPAEVEHWIVNKSLTNFQSLDLLKGSKN